MSGLSLREPGKKQADPELCIHGTSVQCKRLGVNEEEMKASGHARYRHAEAQGRHIYHLHQLRKLVT